MDMMELGYYLYMENCEAEETKDTEVNGKAADDLEEKEDITQNRKG